MPLQHQQTTGQISHSGTLIAIGYSGAGAGKNNPLTRGVYTIGSPHDTPTHGELNQIDMPGLRVMGQ